MKKIAYLLAFLVLTADLAFAAQKRTSKASTKTAKSSRSVSLKSTSARSTSKSAPSAAARRASKPATKSPAKSVKPAAPRPYRLADARTCALVEAAPRSSEYRCVEETDRFLAGESVHLWAKLENVTARYQYQIKTYRNGKLLRQSKSGWHKKNDRPVSSFLVTKEQNTVPGEYRSEFYINVGSGFERIASREYVVEVLSPVDGYVRHQCHWPSEEDVWAFCEHEKTGRRASRGIAMASDRAAIDINLRDYADAGKPVYPVAPGRIVKYGNQSGPGEGRYAAVLVEHTTADGHKWWSGYLHMRRDSIRLRLGQFVDIDDRLGTVGRSGTSNSHLHIAIYGGENRVGGLRSYDVDFRARTSAELRRVARNRQRNDRG